MHEKVHVAIFDYWDVESEIKYLEYFPDWATVTTDGGNCNDTCHLAHSINEAVGYHLIVTYCMIGLLLIAIITLKLKENRKI